MIKDYTIVIPSNNFEIQEEVYQSIITQLNEEDKKRVVKLDGSNYPSFSKLMNDCLLLPETEVIIICSDRCKPYKYHIDETLRLLNEGYGFVGLYRFAFFGLTKHLIKTIGFFDEKYVGGNYEDCDFMRRIREADIAYYEKEQVSYRPGRSSWPLNVSFQINKTYFESKWYEDDKIIKRLKPEPPANYDVGDWPEHNFLSWKQSVLLPPSKSFMDKKFINGEQNVL